MLTILFFKRILVRLTYSNWNLESISGQNALPPQYGNNTFMFAYYEYEHRFTLKFIPPALPTIFFFSITINVTKHTRPQSYTIFVQIFYG